MKHQFGKRLRVEASITTTFWSFGAYMEIVRFEAHSSTSFRTGATFVKFPQVGTRSLASFRLCGSFGDKNPRRCSQSILFSDVSVLTLKYLGSELVVSRRIGRFLACVIMYSQFRAFQSCPREKGVSRQTRLCRLFRVIIGSAKCCTILFICRCSPLALI